MLLCEPVAEKQLKEHTETRFTQENLRNHTSCYAQPARKAYERCEGPSIVFCSRWVTGENLMMRLLPCASKKESFVMQRHFL
jgi:hypothetical protein